LAYNADGKLIELVSDKSIPAGIAELKAEVVYTGEGRDKSKAVTLFINGAKAATRDLGKIGTPRNSVEGLDVGSDRGGAVSTSYKAPFAFTGVINDVIIQFN